MSKNKIIIILVLLLILLFGFLLYRNKNLPAGSIIGKITPTSTPIRSIILPPGGNSDQDYLIETAISDLSTKLNINPSSIKVMSVTEHDWGDTSLGCPEKGKMYAQVITPGFIITLSANGDEYIYHAGGKSVVTC